jgi:hypothetical protein
LKTGRWVLALAAAALPLSAWATDPPVIEHQPVPCTVPGKAVSLCAAVSADTTVATARIYFRAAGEDFYSFVDMAFGGINYCGTLPAPREGKLKVIEYYLQAVDDQYQPTRTSTFQMSVQPEGMCEFPPIEKDPGKAANIKVFATNRKQGNRLHDAFVATGVSFVPVLAK